MDTNTEKQGSGIAGFFIKNAVISWLIMVLLGVGGYFAFQDLGRLEDPEFTPRSAMIVTSYPGASAQQVEEELSLPIENALQQLPYVKYIKSVNTAGLSQVEVMMESQYTGKYLPQIWDEVRRKIGDLKGLPPGADKPTVNDDFGDVYGMIWGISGEGYSYAELESYADYLRREVVTIEGVSKVSVAGTQQQQVFIELSRRKLAALDIPVSHIESLLALQNVVSNAGRIRVQNDTIRLSPTGEFSSVSELKNLVVSPKGSDARIYLNDVADISTGYAKTPIKIMTINGQPALEFGVSFLRGQNVIAVGERINTLIDSLEKVRPIGMELELIYNQPEQVEQAVDGFVISLIQAVAIVIFVLLLTMGLRSGFIIGTVLILSVMGTFMAMEQMAIDLQRISLGALIIALGMLVDNAIVVVEGILIGMQRGKSRFDAAVEIVKQTQWPLLGATVIAVTAFAPIGLSEDISGELVGSLFWVVLFSLTLSWITAITITPFLADRLFKNVKVAKDGEFIDPYKGVIFTSYRVLLQGCIRYRKTTMLLLIVLLLGSVKGFGMLKNEFFPPMNLPKFMVDTWLPYNSDINATAEHMRKVEEAVLAHPEVEQVSSSIGGGHVRFMLAYKPEKLYNNYGNLLITVKDIDRLKEVMSDVEEIVEQGFAGATYNFKRFEMGPAPDGRVEARFVGPDPDVLRSLSAQAKAIMERSQDASAIRDDWRERTKVIRPQFNDAAGRSLGISKAQVDGVLLANFSGRTVGLYRDGSDLLPIIIQPPEQERLDIGGISELQIWSHELSQYVNLGQVLKEVLVEFEDPVIMRRDRKRTIMAMTDESPMGSSTTASVLNSFKAEVEAIELPEGYNLTWGGKYESSRDAMIALSEKLGGGYLVMVLITIFLFASYKDAAVIWTVVPFALIGVVVGLYFANMPFTFLALLGTMSLSGMLIKNAIVLVEEIKLQLSQGKEAYLAVVDASVSRVRPVSMAAVTTVLGMIPLIFDGFFQAMAVAIMSGLTFATILTLIVIPVMYTMIHKIKAQ
ncbi:putative metabolite exporter, AcrB/D/F family [Shewanella sediminis HAW-EB3]|uniref:Putative metabolite exporter, AcrB/D/F family n=1 Tax=Shewanella sediminis (strain HAW-EB3) TaxID=425104 RepID=A8G0H4_SHESH|nr:efflux RND transporter permease subunit [Shewanella sediminis]ABV38597.1 putative metabolite exporter, AcrB/D/F family [Shewanella sediminis HAW-EB3]